LLLLLLLLLLQELSLQHLISHLKITNYLDYIILLLLNRIKKEVRQYI
jgi:hypothetical protein